MVNTSNQVTKIWKSGGQYSLVKSVKSQVFPSPLFLLQTGAVHEDFYKDYDLTVGGEVNVWGRRVIITDCDDFTKEYYRSKYGIGNTMFFISLSLNVRLFRDFGQL